MLLEGKNAIIYGGGGAIGSAVARAFAAEGARVYLAGRTLEKLEKAADVIRGDGGHAHTAQLNALDERPSTRPTSRHWSGDGWSSGLSR